MSPYKPPFEPLLTTPEVGKVLRLSAKGVRDLIGSGKLKAVRVGRAWRVRPSAMDDFLNANDNATPNTTTENPT